MDQTDWLMNPESINREGDMRSWSTEIFTIKLNILLRLSGDVHHMFTPTPAHSVTEMLIDDRHCPLGATWSPQSHIRAFSLESIMHTRRNLRPVRSTTNVNVHTLK